MPGEPKPQSGAGAIDPWAQLKMPSRHKVLQLDPMDARPAGELTSYPFLLEKTEGMIVKVGGLEHFLFSHMLGIIIPIDEYFSRRVQTTNQTVKLAKLSKWVKFQDESLATGRSSIKQSPDISSMPGISGPLGCWSVQLCQAIWNHCTMRHAIVADESDGENAFEMVVKCC